MNQPLRLLYVFKCCYGVEWIVNVIVNASDIEQLSRLNVYKKNGMTTSNQIFDVHVEGQENQGQSWCHGRKINSYLKNHLMNRAMLSMFENASWLFIDNFFCIWKLKSWYLTTTWPFYLIFLKQPYRYQKLDLAESFCLVFSL